MSYKISHLEYSSHLSKGANDFLMKNFVQVHPSEKLIPELPPALNNLKKSPFVVRKFLAEHFIDAILEFPIRSDDVYVCSLPKCGSSWTETIVWLLKHGLNYENVNLSNRQKSISAFENTATLRAMADDIRAHDISKLLTENVALKMAWTEHFDNLESPRIIKTHLPVFAFPKDIWLPEANGGAKVIYVARNAKDAVVSEYHFRRNYLPPADITIDDVIHGVTEDRWIHSPYSEHILGAWNLRNLPNVLFITYEDLVNEPFATIKMISEFLQCSYSDEQLKDLVEFVSFDNMKKNVALNRDDIIADVESTFGVKRQDASFT